MKVRIFLIPPSSTFLNPKILGFLFCAKNILTCNGQWNVKKLNFRKSWEFIKWASKIVLEWNGDLEIFSRPQVIENSRQYVLLRTDILHKTVFGCPWNKLQLQLQCLQYQSRKLPVQLIQPPLTNGTCLTVAFWALLVNGNSSIPRWMYRMCSF